MTRAGPVLASPRLFGAPPDAGATGHTLQLCEGGAAVGRQLDRRGLAFASRIEGRAVA